MMQFEGKPTITFSERKSPKVGEWSACAAILKNNFSKKFLQIARSRARPLADWQLPNRKITVYESQVQILG
jgi:hypothetical protein